jgi:hypothetical protein
MALRAARTAEPARSAARILGRPAGPIRCIVVAPRTVWCPLPRRYPTPLRLAPPVRRETARGSAEADFFTAASEARYRIGLAHRLGILASVDHEPLERPYDELVRALDGLIRSLESRSSGT